MKTHWIKFGDSTKLAAFMTLATLTVQSWAAEFQAHALQVGEDFINPLGFHDPAPDFSWKLPVGIQKQTAYQIVVREAESQEELWNSGRVDSPQSVWVPFGGAPLESRQSVIWQVKFWDESGAESAWSAPATLEMGLLSNQDWQAEWIEPPAMGEFFDWTRVKLLEAEYRGNDVRSLLERTIKRKMVPLKITAKAMGLESTPQNPGKLRVKYEYEGQTLEKEFEDNQFFDLAEVSFHAHPGYYFRKDFEASGKVVKARMHASALGTFEFQINGQRVGSDLLAPGWTAYDARVETISYDVTDLIREGGNTVGALLGEGWYAGTLFMRNLSSLNGEMPKLLGQLELTYGDGRTEVLATDSSWKFTDEGPITASGFYYGEDYDARRELGDWAMPGYNASGWMSVKATKIAPRPLLEPKRMMPVRIMQEVAAKSVREIKPGVFLFDLGQNLVGFPELTLPVRKGGVIHVRVAEMLDKEGTPFTENYRSARSEAYYTAAVDGEVKWSPTLTFFGFQYVELSGFPAGTRLDTGAVVAKVIHTAFTSTGEFTSSHQKLNQLQSNIRWGQIGNFVDLPTDCPQRDERLGWTGDAQVFLPTSFFNYGVHSFWARWLQTVRDEQKPDGLVPHVVPAVALGEGSSPGWGDVIVTAPWEIYVRTGDLRILRDNYDAMKKWVARYERDAEGYINGMKGFGDWLQPYAKDQRGDTPHPVLATAYFGRCARILSWTAEALGKEEEANRFQKLHGDIQSAFTKTFLNSDGEFMVNGTQTGYLMALGYDLIEAGLRGKVETQLLASFESAGRHLRTGFLGTPLLASVFEDAGHPEISYELLFKETYPSWFYSIDQGATTMWERWNSYSHADGFDKGGMNSFNHYAYGAIGQWMYERVAGLTPDPENPGYKHFFVRPLIGGPLEWASAQLDTPYGIARSGWKIASDRLAIDVTVPPNASATVVFPTRDAGSILLDNKPLGTEAKVDPQGWIRFDLNAGTHRFELTAWQ